MIINSNRFLDSNARSFVDVIGTLNVVQKNAINELVLDLKAAGIWSKMKAIYPFIGGTASSHKWNLKDPRDLDAAFRLVFNGGWTHSSTGALPNGTNAYADTYLIPNNNLTVSSGHISAYLRTNVEEQTCDIGAGVTAEQNLLTRWTGLGFITVYGTYNSNSYVANSDSRGLFITNRNSTTNTTGFKNGNKVLDFAQTSGLATGKVFISAQSLSPITRYSSRQTAFATIGDGLTDTEAFVLYQIVEKYQASLGRNINPTEPYYFNRRFDNEANAFIFSAKISDFVTQNATNLLVRDLKFFNLWSKMKAVYPFVGGTASTHKFNLVNPQDSDAAFRILWSGGVTHDANGVTGNGTNAYGDTFIQASTNLSLNDVHISFYNRTDTQSNIPMGIDDSLANTGLYITVRNTSNLSVYKANDNTASTVSNLNALGIFIASRIASNSKKLYKNGNILSSLTTASLALSTAKMPILARTNYNGINGYVSYNLSFATIGNGLTDVEASNLAGIIESFQKNLNRNVNTWYDNGNLLLDLYPNAAVAYSTRKLRNYYLGAAVRVRRSSDNTEQDIFFNSTGDLDTTSLLSFVGAGNGFVTTWYDQSANGRNATQTIAANQPQIVSSGNILLENAKPKLVFDGTNDSFNISSFAYNTTSYHSFVGKRDLSGRRLFSLGAPNNHYLLSLWTDNFYYLQANTTGYQKSTGTDTSTNQLLITGLRNISGMEIYKNNTVVPSAFQAATVGGSINSIGLWGTQYLFGSLQEIIYYNNDQSVNRDVINNNINSYYYVYSSAPTWDGTKTAILDVYPNAAVAYSIRALNSNYTGALLRVRRSSDNQETDIYALQNGELDTAYLLSFVGASNGFVTTWYDQSGNGRNATNTTAANQPQIVSSGIILQINSKPALTFDGTNDSLASSFGSTISQPISIFNTVTYPTYNPSTNKYIFDSASSPRTAFLQSTLNRLQLFSGVVLEVPNTYVFNQGSQYLFSTLSNSTSSNISINGIIGVTGNSGTSGINALTLARRFSNAEYADVKYQELVLYPSDQSTNRNALHTNINTYFNIY